MASTLHYSIVIDNAANVRYHEKKRWAMFDFQRPVSFKPAHNIYNEKMQSLWVILDTRDRNFIQPTKRNGLREHSRTHCVGAIQRHERVDSDVSVTRHSEVEARSKIKHSDDGGSILTLSATEST